MSKDLFDSLFQEVDARIQKKLKNWRVDLRKTTGAIPGTQLPATGDTGTGYTPNPDAVTRVQVRKNSTGSVFERRRLNLIEGAGTTITVADDSGNEEVDITIAASAGSTITVEEVDASPTVSATKIVFPNGTLGVVGTVATYTPSGGGATDAVTTGSTASEIPGLAGSPDRTGIGGGGISEEYDSGSTGLTWNTTAPTNDSNSTIPSHLYVNPPGNTLYYATRSWTPSGAFDARTKVGVGLGNTATAYMGLHIQNSANTQIVTILLKFDSGIYTLEAYQGNPGYSLLASKTIYAPYLRITRDGSNNWAIMYSVDGLGWYTLAALSFTVTVDKIGYYIQSATNNANQYMYSDWLRTDV